MQAICTAEMLTCVSDGGVWAALVAEEHWCINLDVRAQYLGQDVSEVARLQLLDSTCLVRCMELYFC